MDVRRDARSASASEGATTMAEEKVTLRRCIGSKRFGIEAHEAPVGDFPRQPSQKDGIGRMCKTHWNAYTAGLARDAKAHKAAEAGDATAVTEDESASPVEPRPARKQRRPEPAPTKVAGAQGDAG
jgi:hypothetical protein